MRLTYTIDEAAKLLHISQRQLFDMIHNQEIYAFKMGKALRIPVQEIEKILEKANAMEQANKGKDNA